jgi:hypothetical protein
VKPVTVQSPPAVSETGKPDEALAVTVKSESPSALFPIGSNVIVWLSSLGHVGGWSPAVEQTASSACVGSAQAEAERLVASSSAAPASSCPQPIAGVQSVPASRRADCLMMSATW